MLARLNGGYAYNGNFDVPELVYPEVKKEMDRLKNNYFGLDFEISGIHVHDRGHRFVECAVTGRSQNVSEIADYLDSLAFHLYAKQRGEDSSLWPIKKLEE